MSAVPASVTSGFVDAILLRDFSRARSLLHPDIDFRAMTPNRVWEADGPAGVEEVLRAWFEHTDRDVERVDPPEPASVEGTLRVGWRVHGSDADGPFIYEQQAFVREEDGQVVWLRVMCSGPRPAGGRFLPPHQLKTLPAGSPWPRHPLLRSQSGGAGSTRPGRRRSADSAPWSRP